MSSFQEIIMIRSVLFALFVGAVTLATPAAAQFTAWRCDGCTPHQMELLASGRGFGIHYVYDLQNETAKRYAVVFDRELGREFVEETPIEPEVVAFVREIAEVWKQSGLAPGEYVPASGGIGGFSAYDYVVVNPSRNTINQWVSNYYWQQVGAQARNASLIERLRQGIQQVVAGSGTPVQINFQLQDTARLTITITFADGSEVKFVIDKHTQEPTYVPGSAIDANNNSIPDESITQPSQLIGEYRFPGSQGDLDIGRFLDILRLRGIPVEGSGGRTIRCGTATGPDGNGRVTCTRI
ncbi:MAG: hypothetical protein ACK558_14985 [Pseudomonadota bacterium]|jgi:hypothetical protein